MSRRQAVAQPILITLGAVIAAIIAVLIGLIQPEADRSNQRGEPVTLRAAQPAQQTGTGQPLQQGSSVMLQPATEVRPGNLEQLRVSVP